MGTNTSKLNLFKPDGTEFVLRVTDLNDNWDKIDAAFGVTFCTSSTRPSTGLSDGRLIYETDTSALLVYRLSVPAWVYVSPPAVTNSAALTALTPVYNGMMAVTLDTNTLWQRKSGAWVDIFGAIAQPASVTSVQNTSGTTTSNVFTSTLTGGTACSLVFVAPPSGRVNLTNAARMSTSGGYGYCGYRLKTGNVVGSGTDVIADVVDDCLITSGTNAMRSSVPKLITGLTPGSSYNIQQRFAVDSGTLTIVSKCMSVMPVS